MIDLGPLDEDARVLYGLNYSGPWPQWLEVTPAFYAALHTRERGDLSSGLSRDRWSVFGSVFEIPVQVVHEDLPRGYRFMWKKNLDEPPSEVRVRAEELPYG